MFISLCLLVCLLTSVDVCTLHCMFISQVHSVMMVNYVLFSTLSKKRSCNIYTTSTNKQAGKRTNKQTDRQKTAAMSICR